MKPDWKKALDNAKPSFKARNPEYYKSVAGLCPPVAKSNIRGQSKDSGVETGEVGVRCCVVFTVYRSRLLDDGDNEAAALKPLRDRLAEKAGRPSDSRRYFEFHYHQIQSDTIHGTHVLITRL